jgi:hypothetical protein
MSIIVPCLIKLFKYEYFNVREWTWLIWSIKQTKPLTLIHFNYSVALFKCVWFFFLGWGGWWAVWCVSCENYRALSFIIIMIPFSRKKFSSQNTWARPSRCFKLWKILQHAHKFSLFLLLLWFFFWGGVDKLCLSDCERL